MLTRSPQLRDALATAQRSLDHPPASWLAEPPAGLHPLHAETRLPGGVALADAGAALLSWDVHRGAGLRVEADGPARVGGTVVVAVRLGPLWAVAPCRVVEVVDEPGRVGFAYATLPGHPELGVERFTFEDVGDGVRFEVDAVSRPALWASRVAPAVAKRVQASVTARYLAAAAACVSRTT
ncbi:MAG TPA: DUF1990 domain-containing protein [Actinomycetes bacterium]